jgi:hypothetical protein
MSQELDTESARKKAEADRLRAAEKFMVIGSGTAVCKGCGYEYTPDKGDPDFPVPKGVLFQVRRGAAVGASWVSFKQQQQQQGPELYLVLVLGMAIVCFLDRCGCVLMIAPVAEQQPQQQQELALSHQGCRECSRVWFGC